MYKLLNKIGLISLTNLFSYKCEKTNYHLRVISSGLYLQKPRTDSMKNGFVYDEVHLWNSIPDRCPHQCVKTIVNHSYVNNH